MTWLEYYYAKLRHETKLARHSEPTRLLMTMLNNMFADKGDKSQPHELMYLITDYQIDKTKEIDESLSDEFWNRMLANNFYKKTPESAENNVN